MSCLWRFASWNLTMFALAPDYSEACREFRDMLKVMIDCSKDKVVLDEVIEVARLGDDGIADDTESGLEFSESWLREMGLGFEINSIRG